jgi:hypothetical protein
LFEVGWFMVVSLLRVKKIRAEQLPESFPSPRQQRLDRLGRAAGMPCDLDDGKSADVLFQKHVPVVLIELEQGGSDEVAALDGFELLRRQKGTVLGLDVFICHGFHWFVVLPSKVVRDPMPRDSH